MRQKPLTSLVAMFLAAGLALTACSSDDPLGVDLTSVDRQTTSVRLNLAAGDVPSLPDGADSILVRGYNRSGQLVLSPVVIAIPDSGIPELDVPTSTTYLDISVLQDGVTVATYFVQLSG